MVLILTVKKKKIYMIYVYIHFFPATFKVGALKNTSHISPQVYNYCISFYENIYKKKHIHTRRKRESYTILWVKIARRIFRSALFEPWTTLNNVVCSKHCYRFEIENGSQLPLGNVLFCDIINASIFKRRLGALELLGSIQLLFRDNFRARTNNNTFVHNYLYCVRNRFARSL